MDRREEPGGVFLNELVFVTKDAVTGAGGFFAFKSPCGCGLPSCSRTG
jgi:hypothetical protein